MANALPVCGFPRRSSEAQVRLAYGQRPDGTIAHISEVSSGLACNCICPGCGAVLVARKGDHNEHHFGHRSTAECANALESALHKLAKEVLHEKREILLPEVGADLHGRTLVTHPADVHRFDEAILEYSLGGIVPDVIVRKGENRLLVEMFVTHRCGQEKVDRIRAMGFSCVEIDLRRMSRRATREEVEKALLEDARRSWIHNPKLDLAATKLERQIEAELEAVRRKAEAARIENEQRLDCLAAGIQRSQSAPRPRRRTTPTDTMRKIADHGFAPLIGKAVDGDVCFGVPPEEWQAEVIDRFVLAPLAQNAVSYYDFHASDVFQHLKARGMLDSPALYYVSKEDEAALVKRVPGYRTPYRVVESFLWRLKHAEVLVTVRNSRWAVASEAERSWSTRRRRAEEMKRWYGDIRMNVGRILQKVEPGECDGFDLEHWWRQRHPQLGLSFAEAFETDDRRLTQLSFVVHQVEAMLFRHGAIVEDTFGLPVTGAIAREVEARQEKAEAARREREAEEQRRAAERVASIVDAAWSALQHLAAAWLDGDAVELGATPRAAATASQAGLARSRELLKRYATEVERARMMKNLQDKLLSQASQMRRADHARVFLTSASREWRGRRPIDCCIDNKTFEQIRTQMAAIAG